MATHEPIPFREKVSNDGLLSNRWRQFLVSIFGNSFELITSLEEEIESLKQRVNDLENP
jgi:hypothetical protein